MKRVASFSLLVLLVAFPLVAQPSTQGSFNFKGTEGLQTIEFDAAGDERSAQGFFTLAGPTLVSDGEVITGAYALGPEAGEWLQQATLAIRARVPLDLMNDVIQPFPTFSEIFLHALEQLAAKVPVPA